MKLYLFSNNSLLFFKFKLNSTTCRNTTCTNFTLETIYFKKNVIKSNIQEFVQYA